MAQQVEMSHGKSGHLHAGDSSTDTASGAFGQGSSVLSFGDPGQASFSPLVSTPSFAWSPGAFGLTPLTSGLPSWAEPSQGANVVVSTSGSGLVFNNTYLSSCTTAYEACVVAAEKQLESLFSNSDTINVSFAEANSGPGDALGNTFSYFTYSYATLRAALLKVAPNDVLPATDPSGGANWDVPVAYARMLGLSTYTEPTDDTVTLNTYYGWDLGQDVINGITHEMSEGSMGRIGGLGGSGGGDWATMDLFRFNAAGQADYSNGRDGQTSYFSPNGGGSLSDLGLANKGAPTLTFNNNYNTSGTLVSPGDNDDWTQNNVFGSTGGGETLALTQTELEVMQALGWHLTLKQDFDTTSGAWETPTDWSTGSMPIEAQDAYIDSADVTLDSDVLVNSIATSSNAILSIGDSTSSTLTAVDGTGLNSEDVSSVASGNLGEIVVYAGSALQVGYFSETFDNAGSIVLGKGAGGAGDLDLAGGVTLSGGGTLTLGSGGTGDILNAPSTSGDSLFNTNNTISGSGLIELGGTFDNQLDGIVESQGDLQISAGTFTNEGAVTAEAGAKLDFGQDGTTQSLQNTGSVVVLANADLQISGAYTASGSGGIYLKGAGSEITSDGTAATFVNAGTIEADNTSQIGDANLSFTNSGTVGVSLSGNVLTIDTGANPVTNTGTMVAANSGTLAIGSGLNNQGFVTAGGVSSSETTTGTVDLGLDGGTGSAANAGVIAIYGDSDLAISGNYTVSGGGDIGFKGAGADITSDGKGPGTFTNASNIDALASGQIGDSGILSSNDLTFINAGSVYAAGSNVLLTLNTGGNTITNDGLLEAETSATLEILSNLVAGAGSTIEAVSDGAVYIEGALSGGGTLAANSGAFIDLVGGGSFAGAITGSSEVYVAAATTLDAGASLSVADMIVAANLTLASVAVTNASADLFAIDTASGATITLGGTGTGSQFTNAGEVLAEGGGTAVIDVTFVDQGTALASAGTLAIDAAFSGNGTLEAAAGAVLALKGGGSFAGAISGAGTVEINGQTTLTAGASISAANVIETTNLILNGVSVTNAVGNDYILSIAAGTSLGLHNAGTGGTFTNAGTLISNGAATADLGVAFADNGTASATAGTLRINDGLTGTGILSAGAGAVVDLNSGADFAGALSGAGTIDISSVAAILTTGASLSAAHVIETASLTLNSVAITNAAGNTFTVTAGSGAQVAINGSGTGSSFTNAGSFIASGVGTAAIGVAFADAGTVLVSAGTLAIGGALSGNGTLDAAAGAVLAINGGGSFGGSIGGAGTVRIAGQTTLTAGASVSAAKVIQTANLILSGVSVTNASGDDFTLSIASGTSLGLHNAGTGGTFTNAGTFISNGAATADLGVAFVDNGTASATAGTLKINDGLSGTGIVSAGTGAAVDINNGANFAGVLSGAGTIDISTAAATLTTGASLSAAHVIETANLTLSSVAITNGTGDVFDLTAGSGGTVKIIGSGTGSGFTNAGSLTANGAGAAFVTASFVNSGLVSTTSGSLTFIGSVSNSGTIDAGSGLTTIDTTVAGTGKLEVGSSGTLSLALGAGSGQVVGFLAGTGLLDLSVPLDFAGKITGFGGSDRIDLLKTAETSFSYANNVLTVKNGSTTVASLDFTGSSNSFSLTSDNHGGTLITFG